HPQPMVEQWTEREYRTRTKQSTERAQIRNIESVRTIVTLPCSDYKTWLHQQQSKSLIAANGKSIEDGEDEDMPDLNIHPF
ncbi:jg27199, partial [Pararge aegeria aegeria]